LNKLAHLPDQKHNGKKVESKSEMCPLSLPILFLVNLFKPSFSCDRYLMDSVVSGFGRGIYAGKNYKVDETVEVSPSLLIKNSFAMENQLQFFVYATDDENYDAIVFGEGMMYNSLDTENLVHQWAGELHGFDSLYEEPFTNYTSFKYTVERGVRLGEELFVNYGIEWFQQRSQQPIESTEVTKRRYSLADLEKYGFCLSNTYISQSSIPMAGQGLFSHIPYRKGDTVILSPVLVLPRADVESTADSSVLINYCLTSNQSGVALLPISAGGMINNGGISSNVEIVWETDLRTKSHLSWPAKNLASLNYAPLSLKYVAKRPILIGEEITVSYGEEWERNWMKYLDELSAWNEEYSSYGHFMKPQFRQMIEVPSGMFPDTFYECIGKRCSVDPKLSKETNEKKISEALKYANLNFRVGRMSEECSIEMG
jgi:hypothetical protein